VAPQADAVETEERCVVGGIEMPRPFKIRRLGHFGLDLNDIEAGRAFYERLLGFRVSDTLDLGRHLPEEEREQHGSGVGYFMRHGGDHHSFVIFPRRVRQRLARGRAPQVTINQITWQIGSLREVVDGQRWLSARDVKIFRSGRDNPGSNWHCYPVDPDAHTNELYYGIEQIGWNGASKPAGLHQRAYTKPPDLPHMSEYAELRVAMASGLSLEGGVASVEPLEETFDVGGVLLARPFKITKIGPVRLFVADVEAALRFYRDILGLTPTEEIVWRGHRCVFLRANTEHHALALYPLALRKELGLRGDSSLFSFGLQVGDYAQLRDAIDFLKRNDVTIKYLPPELFPGIDYSAFALDPDGHALQLFHYMEQIGWDGRPRPADQRAAVDNAHWPQTLPAHSDSFAGEVYLGPLN
jgi:catechol 2,3-dioxygenase-like lactoylglutathione lyase family enzyme